MEQLILGSISNPDVTIIGNTNAHQVPDFSGHGKVGFLANLPPF